MINKVYKIIDKFDVIVGMIAMLLMIVIVFFQVFSRYILGVSLQWSEEVSRYLMLFIVLLGLGMGTQENKHLGVDAFTSLLPIKIRKYVNYFTIFVTIVIYACFFYYSFTTVTRIAKTTQVSPGAGIPMGIVYSVFPFGFLWGIIWQIKRIIDTFSHFDSPGNTINGKEV